MTVARFGRISRTVWILALILILALVLLWKIRNDGPTFDYTLGGPLYPYPPEQIEGFLLTTGGAQYRLDRTGEGTWTLTGALTDFVNAAALEKALRELTSAAGGPLMPGTQPEDRRFEFNGPGAIRLTVFDRDGGRTPLALGAVNPVTGLVYASGAGRGSCFPVTLEIQRLLAGLPEAVRTKTLLPKFPLQSVTGVEIEGGPSNIRLLRQQDQWWLKAADSGLNDLHPLVSSYHAMYQDRQREQEGELWLLADPDAVGLLLDETCALIVREFVPAGLAEANLVDWNLKPPYRRVTLSGRALNPDPRYGDPDRLDIAFGLSLDGELVPARRLENVMLTDERALKSLEKPASELVEIQALAFPVVLADSISVLFQGGEVLRGHRDLELFADILEGKNKDLDRVEGRRSWVTDFPDLPSIVPSTLSKHLRVRNLVVDLERIPILTVLPPVSDDGMFRKEGRSKVTVFIFEEEGLRSEVLEFGWLVPEHLPQGVGSMLNTDEGEPAGLWRPQTGQLMQVPDQTLVTIRNLAIHLNE
ncbi:MAG: DUF4340 domain-containing protein [Gemmatimonadales bacterium]|nr:DUF4340 domain-containing protein [Gemmatimonadales bacterium]